MYQKLVLIGNLGGDVNMRYTPDGKAVASFSVATSRRWTDAAGQQQERTTWFRVSAWARLAETCNEFLAKGKRVMVEGELNEPKPYQGRDGTWRASLDVTARHVLFLTPRGEQGEQASGADGADIPDVGDGPDLPF